MTPRTSRVPSRPGGMREEEEGKKRRRGFEMRECEVVPGKAPHMSKKEPPTVGPVRLPCCGRDPRKTLRVRRNTTFVHGDAATRQCDHRELSLGGLAGSLGGFTPAPDVRQVRRKLEGSSIEAQTSSFHRYCNNQFPTSPSSTNFPRRGEGRRRAYFVCASS